ncbi:hypothetical protein FM042_01015 [Aliidiomarina halalkaliphila]|uniref:Uncharacterized protein n=1 Tax=Aliidiomarina halalkaliphila TaxID=2593535 RepID=A0A552X3D4_9GAMM|nr:hypothetical protein [Aliidiomarina halalkaliphila]TRW49476.1 hypothetical protein FM042_01015 [Aliidiomarina halalkaliphila]
MLSRSLRKIWWAAMILAMAEAQAGQPPLTPRYLPEPSGHTLVLAPSTALGLRVMTWRLDFDWVEAESFLRGIDDCLVIQQSQSNRLDCITPTDVVTLMSQQGEILWSESQIAPSDPRYMDDEGINMRNLSQTRWEGVLLEKHLEPGPLISVFRRYERLFDDASPWMLYEVFRGAFVLQNRLVNTGHKLTVHGWALDSGLIQVLTLYEEAQ